MSDANALRADGLSHLLKGYSPRKGTADELIDGQGRMRPVWESFISSLSNLSRQETEELFARGTHYLRDAGVYFRQYSNDPAPERDWPFSHVPVILHEQEWFSICDGLAQRADLLEQVMADLYGPAELVKGGHLPAELVARNPNWLRPMVGITPASGHFLHLIAFEISRNPDGSWFVLGDRTQAPSGAGFALENRMATSRIFQDPFPRANIHRLAGFFRAFRAALDSQAGPAGRRAAILTPGPGNDTYFEHTYIARYLGMMLLEGEDMIVHDGQLKVRTVEGLEPLGTLWRRLDSEFADPLELDETSYLGTPGLVQALRLGTLSMVNALGAGVLEMRAIQAFLPRISEVLTGQPLKLPNIATWWCGTESEREHVRSHTAEMMIGEALASDLPFELGATTAQGGDFRSIAQPSIDAWIEAEGGNLVAQEMVTLSTTPAWEEGRLVPRPMTVRVTAARTPTGWTFMPGGYARIGSSDDHSALAMQRGGTVADVWILGDAPVAAESMLGSTSALAPRTGTLPARAAENLFWLGRYVERFEGAVRLLRAYHLRLAETGDRQDPRLVTLSKFMESFGIDSDEPVPAALEGLLGSARTCAGKVRDRFSIDGWNALSDLARGLDAIRGSTYPGDGVAHEMGVLLRKITGFSGLVQENMYRSIGWSFLAFGRALERADGLSSILAAFGEASQPQGSLDIALELGDAVMTHRQRFPIEASRGTVVDLLALDPNNPRAVVFQLSEMRELSRMMPGSTAPGRPSALTRAIMPTETRLQTTDPGILGCKAFVELRAELANISNLLSTLYLR
ncbi:circularly permuted type 2 ATP-grasp protein [Vannielia litorea]|uniref:circularly permuted type 2 ATP-grasp protein n=1 Tax=Vannielia litorea TaxID=1217970 RepID=UPI0021BD2129|nr:circularly permuted type 2 ATP-grasp protein [Vannielia litorea]